MMTPASTTYPPRVGASDATLPNSLAVAAFIERVCRSRGYHYNNTKIQKLLYCCYGCYFAAYGERLCDEYPRAWQYGPVFPRVFNYLHKKKSLDAVAEQLPYPEDRMNLLEDVVTVFGRYTAGALSDWTHKTDSPWHTVIVEMGAPLNSFIPDDIIGDYFRRNIVTKVSDAARQ